MTNGGWLMISRLITGLQGIAGNSWPQRQDPTNSALWQQLDWSFIETTIISWSFDHHVSHIHIMRPSLSWTPKVISYKHFALYAHTPISLSKSTHGPIKNWNTHTIPHPFTLVQVSQRYLPDIPLSPLESPVRSMLRLDNHPVATNTGHPTKSPMISVLLVPCAPRLITIAGPVGLSDPPTYKLWRFALQPLQGPTALQP